MPRNVDMAWEAIFDKHDIYSHDFEISPFEITAEQIKEATRHFSKTSQKEVRIICKQDSSEDRPILFQEKGLFLLPIKNGIYVITLGNGYVKIPPINVTTEVHKSILDFPLVTSTIGDSEMQHLDEGCAK